jgi:hypothetical protein
VLSFDEIEVSDESGRRVLSARDFVSLPLDERVRLLLQPEIQFLKNGESVPRQLAMRSLISRFRPAGDAEADGAGGR